MNSPTDAARPVSFRLTPARLCGALLVVYAAAVVCAGFRSGWNLVDDALILCRYAANAAAGHGMVYNPGEAVEGHSSPLWVALLSAGGRLGMDLPYLSRALGVLSGSLLVLLMGAVLARLEDRPAAIALGLVLAADQGLAVWAVSGMETAGFALLMTAAVLALMAALRGGDAGADWFLGGACGLVALARPEGALAGAILVAVRLTARAGSGQRRGWPAALAFILVMAVLILWRQLTYGTLLPGPVRAKFIPRADALLHGALQALFFLGRLSLVGALAVWAFRAGRSGAAAGDPERRPDSDRIAADRTAAALILLIALFMTMVVVAGGDWMGRNRLPLPVLPLLVLLAALAVARRERGERIVASWLLVGVTLTVTLSWWQGDSIPQYEKVAQKLGEWLARTMPAGTRLGVAAAGAVPYYSGFYATDALGITDPVVDTRRPPERAEWKPGHMRYDLERFLAADPDVIVWDFGAAWNLKVMAETSRELSRRRGDYRRELLWAPAFRRAYRPMAGVPPEFERYYTVFGRSGSQRTR